MAEIYQIERLPNMYFLKACEAGSRSRGFFLKSDLEEIPEERLDDIACDDDFDVDENLDILWPRWFEVIRVEATGLEHSVGYITGYFIEADKLYLSIKEDDEKAYREFEDNSCATSLLYQHLSEGQLEEMSHNYYFLTGIHIYEKDTPELIVSSIESIRAAFKDMYRQEVKTIIYCVHSDYDTDLYMFKEPGDDAYDEIKFHRIKKALLEAGFNEFYGDAELLFLYKDYTDVEIKPVHQKLKKRIVNEEYKDPIVSAILEAISSGRTSADSIKKWLNSKGHFIDDNALKMFGITADDD
jgi:hypothetical protein